MKPEGILVDEVVLVAAAEVLDEAGLENIVRVIVQLENDIRSNTYTELIMEVEKLLVVAAAAEVETTSVLAATEVVATTDDVTAAEDEVATTADDVAAAAAADEVAAALDEAADEEAELLPDPPTVKSTQDSYV